MHDPSDPYGAGPFNRLLPASPSWKDLVDRAMARVQAEEDEQRAEVERAESTAIADATDTSAMYRAVFVLTRAEVESGRTPDMVRAEFGSLVAGQEMMSATVHQAMEDALAGRPPRR